MHCLNTEGASPELLSVLRGDDLSFKNVRFLFQINTESNSPLTWSCASVSPSRFFNPPSLFCALLNCEKRTDWIRPSICENVFIKLIQNNLDATKAIEWVGLLPMIGILQCSSLFRNDCCLQALNLRIQATRCKEGSARFIVRRGYWVLDSLPCMSFSYDTFKNWLWY